ncbi:precorrin-3B synthase [Roseomonas sp. M0104]|uniref:Precorrin-3B synthase n=1 Tax=Teichococcus coralli TaxID=2545983 RepID=A0A845BFZ5_9PROT|nr:precorrin-3B synthase [Pseudoroseomonas coralli]MXP64152.1 precorrin-3B synthase [Pseudoroseomonas coralli]
MTVRGWCPTLFEPMASGDGLLLRVKPRAARLTATQARALAEAAARYGNGWLDLTHRANLQVRGLRPETVAPFTEAMLDAGLADPDPGVERRRSIVAPPLLGADSAIPASAADWLAALEALLADQTLAALPSKFGLVLDGGGALPLHGVEADLILRLGASGAALHLPGADLHAPGATPAAVAALLRAFLAIPGARRMRDSVRRAGAPALFAAAGLRAEPASAPGPAPQPIGCHRLGVHAALGLGIPFGALPAVTLGHLAHLAERHGDGTLRLTPWRALLLPGLADPAPVLAAATGLIADPADPRLRLRACPGTQGCASGLADTRADAATLLGMGAVPRMGLLHLSGCAKGCAHPAPAAVTLVAEAEGRYALIRHGRAGDPPARAGLTLAEAAAELEEP